MDVQVQGLGPGFRAKQLTESAPEVRAMTTR